MTLRAVLLTFFIGFFSHQLKASSCTVEGSIEGPITVSTHEYVKRVFQERKNKDCSSILFLINTPGGVLSITHKIVSLILNSKKPVLCLIYPAGAHAASAGAVIHQACHLNGALKTTRLGAATPITSSGKDVPKDLRKKIVNDMISWLEGIAKVRKRNKKFVKDIIKEAKSITAEEAFKIKAIDHLSRSKKDFLDFAEGKKVFMSLKSQYEIVRTGPLKILNLNFKEKFLEFTSHPAVAALITMGSLFLLYVEITSPGLGVPGILGAVGLIFSFVNLEVLGVRWASILLMVLGVILFVAEAFTPTFGIFSLFGGFCFILGGLWFFDPEKSVGVSFPTEILFSISLLFVLISIGLAFLVWSSRKNRLKRNTVFQILEKEGEVKLLSSQDSCSGQVEIAGEIWKFQSKKPLAMGDKVRVIKTSEKNSLVLEVERKNS